MHAPVSVGVIPVGERKKEETILDKLAKAYIW
jgi:hypothetical protein